MRSDCRCCELCERRRPRLELRQIEVDLVEVIIVDVDLVEVDLVEVNIVDVDLAEVDLAEVDSVGIDLAFDCYPPQRSSMPQAGTVKRARKLRAAQSKYLSTRS